VGLSDDAITLKMAFYSTPSDHVRFALTTNPGSVNDELAGGNGDVAMKRRDIDLSVVVTSNMAYANGRRYK
jgi:hypothetical protein